ncbi:hypothetical protein [Desulfospira joergensenii]|uniref:hypothetical protein n=1 Tax=Desulfospira joergensenii TaxID=53329 RepID=UPI0003B48401|nr:hypothetical protein [Desulfospira joergensenii]
MSINDDWVCKHTELVDQEFEDFHLEVSPNSLCEYKRNPAFYIIADAFLFFDSAKEANNKSERIKEHAFSRAAILLFPVALEAIVNVIYQYCRVYNREELKKIPLKEKWLNVSHKCLPKMGTCKKGEKVIYRPGDKIDCFNENLSIFQKYLELKEIRNDVVHLKPNFIQLKVKEIENFETTLDLYPLTKIPRELSNWNFKHAQIAKNIFQNMNEELNTFMKGSIDRILDRPAFIEIVLD